MEAQKKDPLPAVTKQEGKWILFQQLYWILPKMSTGGFEVEIFKLGRRRSSSSLRI